MKESIATMSQKGVKPPRSGETRECNSNTLIHYLMVTATVEPEQELHILEREVALKERTESAHTTTCTTQLYDKTGAKSPTRRGPDTTNACVSPRGKTRLPSTTPARRAPCLQPRGTARDTQPSLPAGRHHSPFSTKDAAELRGHRGAALRARAHTHPPRLPLGDSAAARANASSAAAPPGSTGRAPAGGQPR